MCDICCNTFTSTSSSPSRARSSSILTSFSTSYRIPRPLWQGTLLPTVAGSKMGFGILPNTYRWEVADAIASSSSLLLFFSSSLHLFISSSLHLFISSSLLLFFSSSLLLFFSSFTTSSVSPLDLNFIFHLFHPRFLSSHLFPYTPSFSKLCQFDKTQRRIVYIGAVH